MAPNAERNAKVITHVKDAQDVCAAIKFADANNLPLAMVTAVLEPAQATRALSSIYRGISMKSGLTQRIDLRTPAEELYGVLRIRLRSNMAWPELVGR
jgi:hypothetical protein